MISNFTERQGWIHDTSYIILFKVAALISQKYLVIKILGWRRGQVYHANPVEARGTCKKKKKKSRSSKLFEFAQIFPYIQWKLLVGSLWDKDKVIPITD
jgi:hypothetical protein